MTIAELRNAIIERTKAIEKRSSSPSVDNWAREIAALVDQLVALMAPPTPQALPQDTTHLKIVPSSQDTLMPPRIQFMGVGSASHQGTYIPPVVEVSTVTVTSTGTAYESPLTTATFTLTRTSPIAAPLSVNFVMSGSATNGTDYVSIVSPATIPAGQASVDIVVTPLTDVAVESTETIVLTLAAGSGYVVGGPSVATVNLIDAAAPSGNEIVNQGYLGLNAAELATMARMKADYDANPAAPATRGGLIYKHVFKAVADKSGTPDERNADTGLCAAWMYIATGDVTYANKAKAFLAPWTDPRNSLQVTFGGDKLRDLSLHIILLYSWTRLSMTPAERTYHMTGIKAFADWQLGIGGVAGVRSTDSDELTVTYLTQAILHYWNIPENIGLCYHDRLNQNCVGFYPTPVGGIDATAEDTSSWRNTFKLYVNTLSRDTSWFESAEYDAGTGVYAHIGIQALRSVYQNAIPEADYWNTRQPLAIGMRTIGATNNVRWQYGDEQNPHGDAHPFTFAVIYQWKDIFRAAAASRGTVNEGLAQRKVQDIIDAWGWTNVEAEGGQIHTALLFYDPYVTPIAANTYPWSGSWYVHNHTGIGYQTVRKNDDFAMLGGFLSNWGVDHQYGLSSDFVLFRNGEWALDHPLGYAQGGFILSRALNVYNSNSFAFAGFGRPSHNVWNASGSGVTAGTQWSYTWHEPYGLLPGADSYHTPPSPIVSARHRIVWMRHAPTNWDVFIIRDDANVLDPRTLPDYAFPGGGYGADTRVLIEEALALTGNNTKMRTFHAPNVVLDTSSPSRVTWTTPGNQNVVLTHLKPSAPGRNITTFGAIANEPPNSYDQTSNNVIRIWNAGGPDADTYVNVIMVGTGVAPTVTLLPNDNVQVGSLVVSFNTTDITVS